MVTNGAHFLGSDSSSAGKCLPSSTYLLSFQVSKPQSPVPKVRGPKIFKNWILLGS